MIAHLYIEVDDTADFDTLQELLDDHEYPYEIASSEGLPDSIEEYRAMLRSMEEEMLRIPEEDSAA